MTPSGRGLTIIRRLRGELIPSEWRGLASNAAALYGVVFAAYLLPLVTVPYLARVLGPAPWGRVAMAQALAAYMTLIVEYGFHLSGTREVARHRLEPDRLGDLLVRVLSARALLAICLLPVAVLSTRVVPHLNADARLVWAAYTAGVLQGLSPLWFLQGLERMRLVAAIEIAARVLGTAGVFALVREPTDAPVVLWLQAAGGTVAIAAGYGQALRLAPLRRPRWGDLGAGLRLGWSMFLFRSAVSLYTAGNALILGLFVPAHLVGYYAGAEKITRALQGLLWPISQVLYPRASHLIRSSRAEAARLVTTARGVMAGGGLMLYVVAVAGAPLWVGLVLGAPFAPAVPVLRVLALVIPLVAISNVLGIQWMLPMGLDRRFNHIIMTAGALNIGLAVVLAPRLGPVGMALAVVMTEAYVSAAMYASLRVSRLDPGTIAAAGGAPQ